MQNTVVTLAELPSWNDHPFIISDIIYKYNLAWFTRETARGLNSYADVVYTMTEVFGGGHDKDYYRQMLRLGKRGEFSEIFAQIFSTRSSDANEQAKTLIDMIVPTQVKLIEGKLK